MLLRPTQTFKSDSVIGYLMAGAMGDIHQFQFVDTLPRELRASSAIVVAGQCRFTYGDGFTVDLHAGQSSLRDGPLILPAGVGQIEVVTDNAAWWCLTTVPARAITDLHVELAANAEMTVPVGALFYVLHGAVMIAGASIPSGEWVSVATGDKVLVAVQDSVIVVVR